MLTTALYPMADPLASSGPAFGVKESLKGRKGTESSGEVGV